MVFNLDPATLIARVLVLIVAFTIHEFAHAWSATQFGDDTPRLNGRLTLNPLAHLDPVGSMVLLLAGFGWAKPVPVNPYTLQRRSPSAYMWVALAGPLSNLMLAILAALLFRFEFASIYEAFAPSSGILPNFSRILLEFVSINLILMVFNLIPLAPLDGEKVLSYLAPPGLSGMLDIIRPYGPLILITLVFVGPMIGLNIFGWIIGTAVNTLTVFLVGL
jgi:Zn-dependent protease